ncbi:uncharacterized protein Z519_11268 [Cladophialophora bantiana CBS 173.52]|uniref:Rab family, other n=1 Tax=Cladophialophora bantiana (strain ATCC 10958 / CBS 173.52 / CDC B-1940 / NIH 8579) TaxID=1442370 RepID=A0A0D2FN56_CLAB1|nr:uncharacterized protein Z519_11268 [Cladophialophora bantiana CBS 173.52]KIW88157.1 hypothetical protein Z519_11268 [Cladophialophora bantiana CBS 173.52]
MARPRRASAASDLSSVPDQNQELGSMYDYLAKIVLLGPSGTGKSCMLHRFVKNEWRVLSSQTIGVEFSSKIIKIGTPPNRSKRIKLQLWDTAGTERFRSVSRSYYRGAAGAILVYDVASMASFQALPTFLSDARALASPQLTVILAGNKSDLADEALQLHGQAGQTHARTQAVHMNGSAHQHRIQREDESGTTPAASSASSRQSYFPYDSGGGGSAADSLKTTSTRSRGDSMNLSKWTATQSVEGREVSTEVASRWASKVHIPVTMEVSALTGENVDALFYRLAAMILTKIELGETDPDDPASGIQYGDGAMGADGDSITTDGGTVRRRKGGRGGTVRNGVLTSLGEWEDVFRRPASRGGRGRCC